MIFLLAIVLAILAPIVARLVQMAISRQREYLADASGVELTRNPVGLEQALAKIALDTEPLEVANRATQHLYFENPIKAADGRSSNLFSTHPPVMDRINRLRALQGQPPIEDPQLVLGLAPNPRRRSPSRARAPASPGAPCPPASSPVARRRPPAARSAWGWRWARPSVAATAETRGWAAVPRSMPVPAIHVGSGLPPPRLSVRRIHLGRERPAAFGHDTRRGVPRAFTLACARGRSTRGSGATGEARTAARTPSGTRPRRPPSPCRSFGARGILRPADGPPRGPGTGPR